MRNKKIPKPKPYKNLKKKSGNPENLKQNTKKNTD